MAVFALTHIKNSLLLVIALILLFSIFLVHATRPALQSMQDTTLTKGPSGINDDNTPTHVPGAIDKPPGLVNIMVLMFRPLIIFLLLSMFRPVMILLLMFRPVIILLKMFRPLIILLIKVMIISIKVMAILIKAMRLWMIKAMRLWMIKAMLNDNTSDNPKDGSSSQSLTMLDHAGSR
ncbi:hypothetical protein O6H91_15G045500 [Diphasiastrum complanatum]|uniref:Uncharacterized protein n=1 Tax=Diphasiastrum complanatum TaxID=34168 RepID=A0ACC2BIT8_DIPCM|nr:hypothetical protein O6H91_15G045500 [Diphasiastrum complanatum]